MTSMFDDASGPAINQSHIVLTVNGTRANVPDGWTSRKQVKVRTEYGIRCDTEYEYPDGKKVIR